MFLLGANSNETLINTNKQQLNSVHFYYIRLNSVKFTKYYTEIYDQVFVRNLSECSINKKINKNFNYV